MNKLVMRKAGLPGATVASVKPSLKPLRLNLQFFADEDPPSSKTPDGFFPTLKDCFKANPHLEAAHKTAITNAVSERFKNYDFDAEEAKAAIKEKREREAAKAAGTDPESEEVKTLKAKNQQLEARTRALALEQYAGDAEQAKLISRLAADKVGALKLNDNFELEKTELDAIVGELQTEFPTLFPAEEITDPAANAGAAAGATTPPPTKKVGLVAGATQKTNTPPGGSAADPTENVKAMLEKLKKTKRI